MEIFLGRQPIFNANKEVIAYELLYRSKNVDKFPEINAETATVKVLVNALLLFGAEKVMKDKPIFVNFTENLLFSSIFDWLEPSQIVIEILESVPLTEHLVKRVKTLHEKGFKIALDDFVWDEQVSVYDELFRYIDYIKVDFLLSSVEERRQIEDIVLTRFPTMQLLAEKVETYDDFHVASNNGYTLFQGYFFEKPQTIAGVALPPNIIQHLHVLSLLNESEPDVQLIAENIERDLSLTYKLLQTINIGRAKAKITSIRQAMMLLGIAHLKKWLYFIILSEQQLEEEASFFEEIMRLSLFRAKVCEIVAKRNYKQNPSEYFLVGLLSLIDTLLKRDLEKIVYELPLSEKVVDTLLAKETEITPYLQLSIALSKLEWHLLEDLGRKLNIPLEEMDEIYSEALTWAEKSL